MEHIQIGPTARVKTDITAVSIVVEGIVIGNLTASTRYSSFLTARVFGNIKTPELIIQDGVVLEGGCTISHYELENTREYLESLYVQEEGEPQHRAACSAGRRRAKR